MFDAHFRRHCESLHALARRTWGRRFLGRAIDRGTAAGTEVSGYTDYSSGADFRHIDWYRCSRHDELLSKQFHGREEQVVYVLVDGSRGMGIHGGVKFQLATRLAAAVGYLALSDGDAVGLTQSGAESPATFRPLPGRRQIPEFFAQVESLTCTAKVGGLKEAAEQLLDRRRKRGLTVVISDFFDPAGYAPAIDLLRRNGYVPQLVQIYAPQEADPARLGGVRLDDVSTGRPRRVRLDEEDLANYRQVFQEFLAEIRGYCRRHSLTRLQVPSDTPFDECVRRMIRIAQARVARSELA